MTFPHEKQRTGIIILWGFGFWIARSWFLNAIKCACKVCLTLTAAPNRHYRYYRRSGSEHFDFLQTQHYLPSPLCTPLEPLQNTTSAQMASKPTTQHYRSLLRLLDTLPKEYPRNASTPKPIDPRNSDKTTFDQTPSYTSLRDHCIQLAKSYPEVPEPQEVKRDRAALTALSKNEILEQVR